MISYASAKKYCKDPIYEIENFREAEADTTTVWDLHHRDEIDKSMKKSQLIAAGEYYHVPASKLMFLHPVAHHKLHMRGFKKSKSHRAAIRESMKRQRAEFSGCVWQLTKPRASSHCSKPIVKTFATSTEAARFLGCTKQLVSQAAIGKNNKTACGWIVTRVLAQEVK